jgi:hypothetical protein
MIITDEFVMLNFPKTGSSFAREALKKIYQIRGSRRFRWLSRLWPRQPLLKELMMPQIDAELSYGISAQHGTLRQIPPEHRHKPILTIIRNPLSRHVSIYRFGWWKTHPPADVETLRTRFPTFPELNFAEFCQFQYEFETRNRLRGIKPKIGLGVQSIQFIQFFFQDPVTILNEIEDDYDANHLRAQLAKITFIHQENLRVELKQFLSAVGIPERQLSVIDDMENVNVTPGKTAGPEDTMGYFDEVLERRVLTQERILFDLFPEYLPGHSPSASLPASKA